MLRHDEYGFFLVNFVQLTPLSAQSLAFPMHIEQVFFAKDARLPRNWKVVLQQKPKGQRSKFSRETNLELTLFDLGNNVDHSSLRVKILEKSSWDHLSKSCRWVV
jgi:hypothetical protein